MYIHMEQSSLIRRNSAFISLQFRPVTFESGLLVTAEIVKNNMKVVRNQSSVNSFTEKTSNDQCQLRRGQTMTMTSLSVDAMMYRSQTGAPLQDHL